MEQWKPVGICAEIKALPSPQFREIWDNNPFDVGEELDIG